MAEAHRRHPLVGHGGRGGMPALCRALGDPHLRLPPVFHVAGTNGKGSTVAFMRAVLEAAGLKVHVYTSPHLVRFEERIVLAGVQCDPQRLYDKMVHVLKAANPEDSFFAVTTAAALSLFAETPADAVLLETGVGGGDDPTSHVPDVAAAAITRISYDHTALLGTTLPDIARAKAGIVRPNRPVVVAPQTDAAVMAVIDHVAQHGAAPVVSGWQVDVEGSCFSVTGQNLLPRACARLPLPALVGRHQLDNAATALLALAASPFAFVLENRATLVAALARVHWPARLQRLQRGPLCDVAGTGHNLWLDGAHNDSGGEVLAEQLHVWRQQSGAPVHLVLSVKAKKDITALLAPVLPFVDAVHCPVLAVDDLTQKVLLTGQPLSGEISAAFPGAPALVAGVHGQSLEETCRQITRSCTAPLSPRIVFAGSLYLAGHILRDHH